MKRDIPLSVKGSLFFGGFLNQFGWFFFGFGFIFIWIFVLNADFSSLSFTGNIISVDGIVINSIDTGSLVNDEVVYKNFYKFIDRRGNEIQNFSYSTGESFKEGEDVVIEYQEGKPDSSRIKGMRSKMFGSAVLFVVIFPIMGLFFIFFALKKGVRAYKLLKYGELTKGKFLSKVPTNGTINDKPIYKLTFSFKDKQGNKFCVSEKTHLPHLLEDDREEDLLYLSDNPDYAIMLDSLPGSPSFDSRGKIKSNSIVKSILPVIIPLLALFGHGFYIVVYLIK